uniref:Protein SPA, chloroplastic n=1 Tax=Solanum tuberosum TaxID=4113 RepID=M0ZWR6_SOLTU
MLTAPSLSRFKSPFISSPLKLPPLSSSFFTQKFHQTHRRLNSYPCIRAVDLDQNTVIAITVGVLSVAIGVGIPVFYETQIDNSAKRENTQPCFPCTGTGAHTVIVIGKCSNPGPKVVLSAVVFLIIKESDKEKEKCRFCMGTGSVTVELGGGETEVSRCINCDGAGGLTCTTCQGSGIQPRYLDRREFKDDD